MKALSMKKLTKLKNTNSIKVYDIPVNLLVGQHSSVPLATASSAVHKFPEVSPVNLLM